MKIKTVYSQCLIIFVLLLFFGCSKNDNFFNPLETGYISYFSFDNHLLDETGYATSNTEIDSISFSLGIKGSGLQLGPDSGPVFYDKDSFINGQKLSVSLWVHTKSKPFITHFIWCSDFIITRTGNQTGLAISIPETRSALGEFLNDDWTHIVGTYDGNKIKCYVNGILTETDEHNGNISDPNRLLRIGDQSGHWEGIIDEFYIFNSELNQEQVSILYDI